MNQLPHAWPNKKTVQLFYTFSVFLNWAEDYYALIFWNFLFATRTKDYTFFRIIIVFSAHERNANLGVVSVWGNEFYADFISWEKNLHRSQERRLPYTDYSSKVVSSRTRISTISSSTLSGSASNVSVSVSGEKKKSYVSIRRTNHYSAYKLTVSQLNTTILLLLPVAHTLGAVLYKLLAQLGTLLQQFLRGTGHADAILALELCIVLLKVFANFLLLFIGQQSGRSRTPQEEDEVLQIHPLQYPALEGPNVVAVIFLGLENG